jgi:hypothetical protein
MAGRRSLRLATTIVAELAGEPIGDLMLRVEDAWAQAEVAEQAGKQVELGLVLDPAHAGHGYTTEAARELLRVCFEDLGVHRVVATCFVDNVASWRLWSASACAVRCMRCASLCTGPGSGTTRSRTRCLRTSGRVGGLRPRH